MLISGLALAFGLRGDYPVRVENDENFYLAQSIDMVNYGLPEPEISCNPASTIIYPLVLYFSLAEHICYPNTEVFPSPYTLLQEHPFLCVLVPRLLTAAVTIATIPFLFLLCRNLYSTRAAVCATFLFALHPMVIQLGQIVRSDNIALFFEVLTLYFGFRLLASENRLNRIGTGLSLGLAIASRYFMLALLPFVFLIDLILFRRKKRSAKQILQALSTSALGILVFLATTPFFVLDFKHYMNDLHLEQITPCLGADNLSPIGNALFYIRETFPYYFSEPLLWLIGVGAVASLLRCDLRHILLFFLLALFFAGTCANGRHWPRWMLPLVPILVMFIGYAIDSLTRSLALPFNLAISRLKIASKLRLRQLKPLLGNVIALLSVVFLSMPYASALVSFDLAKNTYATDVQMYYWIKNNLPKKTPICMVGIWEVPDRDDYKILNYMWGPEYFDTVNKGVFYTVPEICAQGYHLFIVREVQVWNCRMEPERYRRELSFFNYLEKHARRLKNIDRVELKSYPGGPTAYTRGSAIYIYEMPDALPTQSGSVKK